MNLLFTNEFLNRATVAGTVLLVFALAGLIAFYATSKEGNKLKYSGNKRLAKYKFSEKVNERRHNEFLDVFSQAK